MNNQTIKELGLEIYLSYGEDERYPTLVISKDTSETEMGFTVGYDLSLDDGELRRICLCHASCSGECLCGAWNE